jgi:hypothetical protein
LVFLTTIFALAFFIVLPILTIGSSYLLGLLGGFGGCGAGLGFESCAIPFDIGLPFLTMATLQ